MNKLKAKVSMNSSMIASFSTFQGKREGPPGVSILVGFGTPAQYRRPPIEAASECRREHVTPAAGLAVTEQACGYKLLEPTKALACEGPALVEVMADVELI